MVGDDIMKSDVSSGSRLWLPAARKPNAEGDEVRGILDARCGPFRLLLSLRQRLPTVTSNVWATVRCLPADSVLMENAMSGMVGLC